MNKNLLYGIIVVIVIIAFTFIWKNSQKEETNGEVINQPIVTETTTTTQTETAASIQSDVDSIEIDSGIDADLKAIDADLGTL